MVGLSEISESDDLTRHGRRACCTQKPKYVNSTLQLIELHFQQRSSKARHNDWNALQWVIARRLGSLIIWTESLKSAMLKLEGSSIKQTLRTLKI
jgi:hypothetical protein